MFHTPFEALGTIIEGTAAGGSFARHGVDTLRHLVPSELTTLSLCDLDTGHRSVVSDVPGAISGRELEAFDRHFHEHPLLLAHRRNPGAVTQRLSDVACPRAFRRSPMYGDYYRRIGIEHVMAVPFHGDRNVVVSFVFNRSGCDFSDRDRAVLENLRPHLGHLYRLSRAVDDARNAWGVPPADPKRDVDPRLTGREREVLDALAGGKTDRDIAEILGISPRTVHKHLQHIYEKLGVETRTAAVMRLMRA
jgi:DNA-binding CsgD family transcriptional regulator